MAGELYHRLESLSPTIQNLMHSSGMPGLSISVATKGQPTYHANYGVQDLETTAPVNENTIFPVCSLAKSVSSAALGILVDQGAISWETPIKDIIPSFRSRDEFLQAHTTLSDVLSHTTGMSSCGNLVAGSEAGVLIRKEDRMRVVNDQVLLPDRRGSFFYNSTAWEICDEVIEHISGRSTHEFIRDTIFKPLAMERSFMITPPTGARNIARSYNALDDGSTVPIPSPKLGDNGIGSASGGLRSCATDLVKLYTAFMRSYHQQSDVDGTIACGSPLKQLTHLMSAKVPLSPCSDSKTFYGLGWALTQLPSTLGHIGLNGRLMPGKMPVLGKGTPSQLVFYHQGTLPGALATAILLPDTETIVVVLGNCLALSDVPDWVSQMILEEVLQVPSSERIEFLEYFHQSIDVNLEWYSAITKSLESQRQHDGEHSSHLAHYVGTYRDRSGVFSNVVSLEAGELFWSFQGLQSEKFKLTHYQSHVFTWLQPRNALSRRGRWVLGDDCDPSFWKVQFVPNRRGDIDELLWVHDPSLEPVTYRRESTRT